MQFTPLFLFTIICGYSMVNSAPVNHTVPDTQEAKHQKATAIANRLLKELAGEQLASHHQEQNSITDDNKDKSIPVNRPAVEKVESHVAKQDNDINTGDDDDNNNNDDDDVEIDFTPTLEDLYELYGDKYGQFVDDEESSSEINDDDEYILPVSAQQLMEYLEEQEGSDEQSAPVIHTPMMDDSIMTAEDHQRRRRSIH